MAHGGNKLVVAAIAALFATGAIADTTARSTVAVSPVIARVPGTAGILRADVVRRAEAVMSPAVTSQFRPAEVTANVLTELIGLDLDRRLATSLGVTPDTGSAAAALARGVREFGSAAAYQQQLIRAPGNGWAGADIYSLDTVLRSQLAMAEATRLTPVPDAELQSEYAARLGAYQNAHVQILTTPDLRVATRDAGLARADPGRFPALVRADTDDDTHRSTGGDYGPSLARGQLYATVDDAIFAAIPGTILGPITVEQAAPEYYVVRVLSVVDIPLGAATTMLVAEALDPTGSYVQGRLTVARAAAAAGVTVESDAGAFSTGTLSVVPPASSGGAAAR